MIFRPSALNSAPFDCEGDGLDERFEDSQMTIGSPGQALEARIGDQLLRALSELTGSRPRQHGVCRASTSANNCTSSRL
jgi:hypothetical protein